jgi:hypothetical protein
MKKTRYYRVTGDFYSWAIAQKNPVTIIAVFNAITNRANWNKKKWNDGEVTDKGEARVTISKIAKELKLPRTTVRDVVRKLIEAGFIKVVKQEPGADGFVSIFEVCWLANQPATPQADNPPPLPASQPATPHNQLKRLQDKTQSEPQNQQPATHSATPSRHPESEQPAIRRKRIYKEEKEINKLTKKIISRVIISRLKRR